MCIAYDAYKNNVKSAICAFAYDGYKNNVKNAICAFAYDGYKNNNMHSSKLSLSGIY